jgi:hypothetical protein
MVGFPYLLEVAMLTRDDMIREYRSRAGTLPALLLIYGVLLGTLALSAATIL